jgi:chemotaxis protein MotB
MARKKKHAEHVNHERWLISYADFITLLFAFFVVMFAVSQVDSKKVGRFTESFSKAVGIDIFPQPGKGILPGVTDGTPGDAEAATSASPMPEDLNNLKVSFNQAARGDPALQMVQLFARRNELVLRLSDGLLFESGDDSLREQAVKVIEHIGETLKARNVDIRVEGHTDNRPIHTAHFRSNWDLSTSRATAVVVKLAGVGIDPKRISAAGYGEFHPLASNTTVDGQKLNRRVDLVVSITPKETEK